MDMNYYQTLIAVADDSPVSKSEMPMDRGGKKTIAGLQFEMLADNPYVYTQEDVLFNTWLQRQNMPTKSESEIAKLRDEFFAKPQPCLRSSPLPKKYGWGVVFDEKGRAALVPMESKEYAKLLTGGRVKILKALRSSRA